MEEDSGGGEISNEQCLLCREVVVNVEDDDKLTSATARKKLLLGFGCDLKENSDLKSQISVFFMLRKVLGLSSELINILLLNCGNPSEWKIKLCRLCTRLFKEAEHLWDRMMQLQRDYDKVTYEIKDNIINSISPEEVEILNEDNGIDTKKSKVRDKLDKGLVTEGIRGTFFIDLYEQNDNDAIPQGLQIPELSTAVWRKGNDGLRNGLNLNRMGMSYLSLADLEMKMKEVVQMTCIAVEDNRKRRKKCTKSSLSSANTPALMTNYSEGTEQKKESMSVRRISQETESPVVTSQIIIAGESSNESKVPSVPPFTVDISSDSDADQQPRIRIVQPHLIMEPEEENEETDSIPPVKNRDDKNDSMELIMDLDDEDDEKMVDMQDTWDANEDTNDPLGVSNCSDTNTNVAQSGGTKTKTGNHLRIKFVEIRPVRKVGKDFECSKCLSSFETRLGCQIHVFRDHYDEVQAFQCHLCSEKFSFYQPLRQHVSETHRVTQTAYEDNFNPITFFAAKDKDSNNSNNRDAAAGTGVYNVHPLSKCSIQLKTKRAHAQIEEMRNPPGFDSHICSRRNIAYRAVNKDMLEIHMRKMHNNNGAIGCRPDVIDKMQVQSVRSKASSTNRYPKPTIMRCLDCGKLLPDGAALAEHLKNPEIKCPLCTKHFLRDEDRNQHLENEHKNFQCQFCQKSFTSQIVYEKHIENHKSQEFGVHVCPICQIKVNGYDTLRRHMSCAHNNSLFASR